MSVAHLKMRLADVPGIQNLSLTLQAGKALLAWGEGYAATVDAAASDYDVETAIRDAIKRPPLGAIPDKPAAPVSAPVVAPPATPPTPTGQTMSNPASAGLSVKQMMEDHTRLMGDIHAAQLRILESTLARQRDAVSTAVGNVATKIDGQTDEFLSIMGQFTNDLGI